MGHQYPPRERNINRIGRPCSLTLYFLTQTAVPQLVTSGLLDLPTVPHRLSRNTFSPTMTAPAEPPRYVYKIVDTEPPFPIPDVFPPSELDKKEGFIHLSAPWQVSQATIETTITYTSSTVTRCSLHWPILMQSGPP